MQLNELTVEHFESCVGQVFTIHYDPEQTLETTLAEVIKLGPEPPADKPSKRRRAFSVLFQGPMTPIMQQGIYTIDNSTLGSLDIFIVPLGPDSEQQGIQYEAIFT
jgi:hypothetical protein